MATCKFCGCTEYCACKGGCFWVNREQTICSSCAIRHGTRFINRVSDAIVRIISANIDEDMSPTVTIEYEDSKRFTITALDFMYHYSEV